MAFTIVLVGPRATRQGTGPFVAAALKASGANIVGIVGRTAINTAQAQQQLRSEHGIHCQAYTSLEQALQAEQPDAVAICSPWQFHAEQLRQVAQAGSHCLVEKPLAWPSDDTQVDHLIGAFEQRGLLLEMIAQWPFTLTTFCALHGALPNDIHRFQMRLSPMSVGSTMITDSAPHFISMLQHLMGPGDCHHVVLDNRHGTSEKNSRLTLSCSYSHASGECEAQLLLETCAQRPRPAWYQINEQRADRAVELPEYQQFFVAGEHSELLPDPLHSMVHHFVKGMLSGRKTSGHLLRQSHQNLLQLNAPWEEKLT